MRGRRRVGNHLGPLLAFNAALVLLHVLEELGIPDRGLNCLAGHSEHLDQRVEVLLAGVRLNEDFLREELGDDATERPHVNAGAVVRVIVEVQLRCPVVPRRHVLGQIVVLVDLSDLDVGLTEVTDFDVPVLSHQNIQWLQIAMNDTLRVHIVDAFENLEREVLDLVGLEGVSVVADDVHQVLGAVLGDQVQGFEIFRIRGSHDAFQCHDVPVTLQNAQQSQLTEDPMSVDVVFEDVLHFLDGHNFVLFVGASPRTIFLLQLNHAFVRPRAYGVFGSFVPVGLEHCTRGAVADDLPQFVVSFDFNRVVDFVLEACLLDLLLGA